MLFQPESGRYFSKRNLLIPKGKQKIVPFHVARALGCIVFSRKAIKFAAAGLYVK